jgi:glycolate oxidase
LKGTSPFYQIITRKPFCVNRSIRVPIGGEGLTEKPSRPIRDSARIARMLKEALGDEAVADDLAERRLYDHDVAPTLSILEMTYKSIPDAVVRPRDAAQVSDVLRLANKHGFPVIPRGAATWGLGGAVPATGGVVLDLTSLDRVIEVDVERSTIAVEAGASWQKAIDAARKKGLHVGTYPSSYPSATVGGWIGVGGAGIGSCKYGPISDNLAALQVVLPDGSIIDSAHQGSQYPVGTFIGTEGIFGVTVRATIKAYPLPARTLPFSFCFDGLADAGPFLWRMASEIRPMHVMFSDKVNFEWLEAAGVHTGVQSALVTVVLEGQSDEVEKSAANVTEMAASSGGKAAPPGTGEREWRERPYEYRFRKLGTGSLPAEALIPLSEFRPAVEEAYVLMRRFRLNASMKGTLADNRTFQLMPYYLIDERRPLRTMGAMSFNVRLAEMAFRRGGRIAGLGMYLPFLLEKMYPGADIERMLALKKQLDPRNVLNPGKLLEGRYGSGRRMSPYSSRISIGIAEGFRRLMRPERLPRRSDGRHGGKADGPEG